MYTVLVTGGTGFIGSHTVTQLLAEGFNVRCLVRPGQVNLRWLQDLPVELAPCDLLNPTSILKCLDNIDFIIHVAGTTKAKHKSEFFTGNVSITNNLLSAASQLKHLKKFCFVSSLTAAGPSATGIPLNENAVCHPVTTYGQSKLDAERLCKNFSEKVPIVIIRPPAVFGPRDKDILEFFKWVNYGVSPIFGSKEKTLSVVYAPDLAQGIIRATIDERTIGETYNIADPTIYTFTSLMDYFALAVNRRTRQIYLPKVLIYSMAGIAQLLSYVGKKPAVLNIEKARDLLQAHWICDPQKIQEHIGFRTSTTIVDGIRETFQWYKNQHWL